MVVPPNGWRVDKLFRTPSPGAPSDYIFGGDLDDLCKNVTAYRISNNLDIDNIELRCQDWICKSTQARCQPANPARPIDQGAHISGTAIARFLAAMAAWVVNGGQVGQEEAERRASICAGCKFNQHAPESGCSGCFGLAARVMRVIGDRTTRMDDLLKFCGNCGCSLHVVPFVPIEILDRAHKNEDFPMETGQFEPDGTPIPCWRKAASVKLLI